MEADLLIPQQKKDLRFKAQVLLFFRISGANR